MKEKKESNITVGRGPWKEKMEECKGVILVISDEYFLDPLCVEELIHAKKIGKELILLIKEGTEIDENHFKECNIIARVYFTDKDRNLELLLEEKVKPILEKWKEKEVE